MSDRAAVAITFASRRDGSFLDIDFARAIGRVYEKHDVDV